MKSGRVRRVRVTVDRGTPDLDVPGQLPAQIPGLAEQVQAHHDRIAQRTANNGTGLVPRHVAKRHNDALLSDQVRNMICNRWEPHRYPGAGGHHETRCARIHSLSVRAAVCSSQGDQVARVGCGGEVALAENPTDTAECPRSAVISIAFSKQESRAASARRRA